MELYNKYRCPYRSYRSYPLDPTSYNGQEPSRMSWSGPFLGNIHTDSSYVQLKMKSVLLLHLFIFLSVKTLVTAQSTIVLHAAM